MTDEELKIFNEKKEFVKSMSDIEIENAMRMVAWTGTYGLTSVEIFSLNIYYEMLIKEQLLRKARRDKLFLE